MPLRGKIIIIALFVLLVFYVVIESLYPFLAISRPVHANLLIVEGWIPDYALNDACQLFQRQKNYQYLVVTAQAKTCVDNSSYLSCKDNSVNKIINFGINKNVIIPIAVPDDVRGSRTYNSAIATRKKLTEILGYQRSVDVYTHATHARETLVMFKKAFGKNVCIGIIAAEPQIYNARSWWMSKTGIRLVLKGAIGYVYAELYTLFDN